jgi:hypothetical protein
VNLRAGGTRRIEFFCGILLGLAFFSGGALAGEGERSANPLVFYSGADAWSAYWWRGELVTDRATVQPSVTLAWEDAGLEVTGWGSAAVQDRDRLEGADEIDVILGFARPFTLAGLETSLSLGYTQYLFPNGAEGEQHTEELLFGVGAEGLLAPSITAYYDFGIGDGTYLEAVIAPEVPLRRDGSPSLVVEATSGAGNVGGAFTFRDLEIGAAVRFQAGSWGFAPRIGYGTAPSGPEKGEDRFFAGASLSIGE